MIAAAENIEQICLRTNEIAAFLDGEMATRDEALFEKHLSECCLCAEKLNEQKRLLRALNSVFAAERDFELPANFVKTVVVRAESNVAGLRSGDERRRALIIVSALFLAGFAFGFVGRKSGFLPDLFGGFARSMAVVASVLFNFCFDFGVALVIALRAFARYSNGDSPLFAFLLIVLLVAALAALSRLLFGDQRVETQK